MSILQKPAAIALLWLKTSAPPFTKCLTVYRKALRLSEHHVASIASHLFQEVH